jgi:hypothetical protein
VPLPGLSIYKPQQLDNRFKLYFPCIIMIIILAGGWWHTPLIPALGRQREADF